MKKRWWCFIVVCIASMFNSGCGEIIEHPSIENYGMVGIMGFDLADDGDLSVTLTLPQPDKDAEEMVQNFTTKVKSPHQAIIDGSSMSEKVLSTAQLRVVLFSEELAREEGVWQVLENLYRDPRVGTNIFIAVVKGSVQELLTGQYKDKPNINRYLNELLTPRTITAFSPFTTIHEFINKSTDDVSDPSVPYIEKIDDSIKITNVALFKNSHMVDLLNREEAKIIENVKGQSKGADITFQIEEDGREEMVVINFIRSRSSIKTNGDPMNPEVFIYLYVRGALVDYDGQLKLTVEKDREKLAKKLEKNMESRIISAVTHFQELGIDPLNIGEYFRVKDKSNWSKEHWNEVFQRAEITTHVETTIMSTGTLS